MNDPNYHRLWHELNEANVEVVLAYRAPKDECRARLAEALRRSRTATGMILEILSERGEKTEDDKTEDRRLEEER